MRLIRLLMPSAALFLLLSCGGGGGGGGNPQPNPGLPAPTNLHTITGPGPKEFTLAWDAPAATIDGYNLEAQEGTGTFQQLNTVLISPSYTSLLFTFLDGAPEDTTFTFRIDAVKGTLTSPYSNTTTANSGLGTPGLLSGQYDWNKSGVAITWSRNSAVSTGCRLQRAQSDAYGNPTESWTLLTVADPLASSYLDTTAAMGNYYIYRVTNTKGTVSSLTSSASGAIFTGLSAPSQPTATFDFTRAGMSVTWTKNTTFNDGVKIERIQTNSYGAQTGTWAELTPTDPMATAILDTSVVSNTYYAYRVTNLRGGIASAASNPSYAAYAGLAPPSFLSAFWDSTKGGVAIYWGASVSYESVNLERVVADANGLPTGSWATLASLAGSSSGYTDLGTQEITAYLYRVSGTRGSFTSPTLVSNPVTTSLKAPVGLSVVPVPGGLKLTWQNLSLAANQLIVRRTPGIGYSNDIAILSPGTTSYTDQPSNLGYYSYTVTAKNGYQEASSQAAKAATPNPPGSLSLTATTLFNASSLADAALRPAGTWAVVSGSPFGVLSNNDPWPAYFPANYSRSSHPVVQIDKSGWPHAIYAKQSGTVAGEYALVHLWYDGSGWKTETLVSAKVPWTSANAGWTYRLDSSGTPHVLLDHATSNEPYGGSTSSLSYLHKTGGAWVEEPLTALSPSVSNVGTYHLALDGSDVAHVLIGNWSSVNDYVRTGTGAWTSTTIPTGAVNAGWYDYLDAFWIDGANGWVFFENSAGVGGMTYSLSAVQMKAGTWQSPVVLGGRDHDGSSTTAAAALSPDRSRTAILYKTSAGIKCYHQAEDGWHETLVASNTASYPLLWLGFDTNQKVHILQWSTTGDLIDFHE